MAVEELHKVVTLFCPLEKLECLGTVLTFSEESCPVWRKYATRKQILSPWAMGIKPVTFRTASGCSGRSEIITPFIVWGVVLWKSRRIVFKKITDSTPYRTFLVRSDGISANLVESWST